jgi:uncharacterized protein (DUF2147 family)
MARMTYVCSKIRARPTICCVSNGITVVSMVKYAVFTALACFAATLFAGSAGAGRAAEAATRPDQVVGNWTTEDGNGVIAIENCGDSLCGRIVGIQRAPGEPIPKDVHGDSQCGLVIISNERPTHDGHWLGNVTDPRDGTTYGAQLWLDEDHNLRIRGFLGLPLLGQTKTWHPFTGHLTGGCGFA